MLLVMMMMMMLGTVTHRMCKLIKISRIFMLRTVYRHIYWLNFVVTLSDDFTTVPSGIVDGFATTVATLVMMMMMMLGMMMLMLSFVVATVRWR